MRDSQPPLVSVARGTAVTRRRTVRSSVSRRRRGASENGHSHHGGQPGRNRHSGVQQSAGSTTVVGSAPGRQRHARCCAPRAWWCAACVRRCRRRWVVRRVRTARARRRRQLLETARLTVCENAAWWENARPPGTATHPCATCPVHPEPREKRRC